MNNKATIEGKYSILRRLQSTNTGLGAHQSLMVNVVRNVCSCTCHSSLQDTVNSLTEANNRIFTENAELMRSLESEKRERNQAEVAK